MGEIGWEHKLLEVTSSGSWVGNATPPPNAQIGSHHSPLNLRWCAITSEDDDIVLCVLGIW
jgi:hypothetical protein